MVASEARAEHESETCPACGRCFEVGELVSTCEECLAVYHVLCWESAGGCVNCSRPASSPEHTIKSEPDLVINGYEARMAKPPPPGMPVRPAEEVAAEFAPRSSVAGKWLTGVAVSQRSCP